MSKQRSRQKCTLTLSNGMSFTGELIGAPLFASGELVFTTGMVGYSEALTDPSYYGQILLFSYPLIGNYGVPKLPHEVDVLQSRGFESAKVHASAVLLAVDSPDTFHWTSHKSLDEWLCEQNVPGIVGIDPRHLIHLIRDHRGLMAKVTPEKASGSRDLHLNRLVSPPSSSADFFNPSSTEVLSAVSCDKPYVIGSGRKRLNVVDCGIKWNILRQLHASLNDCEIQVLPWNTKLSQVDGSGWLLSNGPGDPEKTGDLVKEVKALLTQDRPLLGICLGHQILALASGAKTKKMPYGHRSHNQPVQLVGTRRGFITSQNHGYVVDDTTLQEDWEPWFINANDQSIEGIKHKSKPFRSVQFHPEAAGGPRDTGWIIEQFAKEI